MEQQWFLPHREAHGWECGSPRCPVCSHGNHNVPLLFTVSHLPSAFTTVTYYILQTGLGYDIVITIPMFLDKETGSKNAGTSLKLSCDLACDPRLWVPRSGFHLLSCRCSNFAILWPLVYLVPLAACTNPPPLLRPCGWLKCHLPWAGL